MYRFTVIIGTPNVFTICLGFTVPPVLLVPDFPAANGPELQRVHRFFGTLPDQDMFQFANLAPGDYTIYTFPKFEHLEFRNPAFLRALSGLPSRRARRSRNKGPNMKIQQRKHKERGSAVVEAGPFGRSSCHGDDGDHGVRKNVLSSRRGCERRAGRSAMGRGQPRQSQQSDRHANRSDQRRREHYRVNGNPYCFCECDDGTTVDCTSLMSA